MRDIEYDDSLRERSEIHSIRTLKIKINTQNKTLQTKVSAPKRCAITFIDIDKKPGGISYES